jgi:hypothetical protein
MANELLILPLHQILSVQGLKVEAKLEMNNLRERSQGRAVMRVHEVACLPSSTGSHLGRSQDRASPHWAKIGQSAYLETGRAIVGTDNGALMTLVIRAIMCSKGNDHLTDEVPRCPRSLRIGVSATYKSETKGSTDASETRMATLQPRLKGCRQRQSRSAHQSSGFGLAAGGSFERQSPRVSRGPFGFMGPVSPGIKATTWPGGTSSCQTPGSLRNRPQQPKRVRTTVHTR